MAITLRTTALEHLPARVFPAIGVDGLAPVENLALEPGIERVASPRQASILLVAGYIPEADRPALRRLHDQLPHPRTSVYWGALPTPLDTAVHIDAREPPTAALRALNTELLLGRRTSAPALLPDLPPAPWRGKGDHGQGGEGMMGGRPYGRPMAMTDEDGRDGLPLDASTVTLGPFAPMLPPGLRLQLTLQGDVIQRAEVTAPPNLDPAQSVPWQAAGMEEVAVAELERYRAAHHFRHIGRLLSVRGLGPLAARAFLMAHELEQGTIPDISGFKRRLRWSGLRFAISPGLGRVDRHALPGLTGPAARAAATPEDRRSANAEYRRQGFHPVVQNGGDVRARLAQWLAEAEQSLGLAAAFGTTRIRFDAGVEAPWGPSGPSPSATPAQDEAANRLLVGREWSEAMTVLASFDHRTLHWIFRGTANS